MSLWQFPRPSRRELFRAVVTDEIGGDGVNISLHRNLRNEIESHEYEKIGKENGYGEYGGL